MDSRLDIWFFFEIIREYPRVVHIFKDFENDSFRAEFYISRVTTLSDNGLEYETEREAKNAEDLFYKIIKFIESLDKEYEMQIKYDASNSYY